MKRIRIGTRGSALALWQAKFLQKELSSLGHESELHIIKTKGDRIQHLSFDKIEGKGFFTKEIEEALLQDEVDVAVHSMKDLPTSHPSGLVIAGVSYRANPQDVLLINPDAYQPSMDLKLKENPIVGTSSARRKAQILHLRNDCTLKDIRGNVPTRIQKLIDGQFDAIILAAAGVERLSIKLGNIQMIKLHPKEFVPAPAQGILAYQCKEDRLDIRKTFLQLHHGNVSACSNVERSVLQKMDGGCHLPLGVYCYQDEMGYYHCHGAFSRGITEPLVKSFISQSTSAGLAENMYNQLING